ncbi:ABC superfamily ATP binding cassette membrane [Micractinium conductrix]|uniref:ABC superfamily ATP binding cassette membrane n=1 Tax=Micractinium conductrix TaxID=554055 RepID=A0A2P6VJM8_9CHLO|nr:ABC superfamily ATP binding cassette membrane [Micractinium conductrix]|eukprot:PSC74278.1 ABC superfamily ATP binding cassette membrane [Micractinium conductrix]
MSSHVGLGAVPDEQLQEPGAAAAALVAGVLCLAAGKPVLQALDVVVMLACAAAASLVWRCTPWCSALAGFPPALAGFACLFNCCKGSPRVVALLSKAAFVATLVYLTTVTRICQACSPDAMTLSVTVSMVAAAAGAVADSRLFSTLAKVLLPQLAFDALHDAGIVSDTLLPEGWKWVFIARLGVAVLVVSPLVILDWQAAPFAEVVQAWAEAVPAMPAGHAQPGQPAAS